MRATREVMIGDRRVTVRELTVGEIRAWLKGLASATEDDAVGGLLYEDVTLGDLAYLSDLPADELDRYSPSELRTVLDAAREVNADFFAMRARLLKLGKSAGLGASEQSF